jgi:hypothetical protein
VLSETAAATAPTPGPHTSPDEIEYLAPTSVDPAHLNLNLRIAAFTEASRTIPLPYPGSALEPPEPPCIARPDEPADMTGHQVDLLSRAQKLYTSANMLPKPSDRVKYLDELAHISGLLAYRTPEESPMALYLSQARREAVAEQINSAILCCVFSLRLSYSIHLNKCLQTGRDYRQSHIWSSTHDTHRAYGRFSTIYASNPRRLGPDHLVCNCPPIRIAV